MWWRPDSFAKKVPYLQARARIFAEVRAFFDARGYLEVDTPALQAAPCMETHIQGFKTELLGPDRTPRGHMYLHTSPEFAMKKLLVAGMPKIYQLAKVFRNAEGSSWHSPEFTMLEWYQTGMDYKDMMQETVDLVRAVVPEKISFNGKTCDVHQPWEKLTVVEAVRKYAGIDISNNLGDLAHIRAEAARIGVYVSPHDDWDNALLKIMMDKVEPHAGSPVPTIVYDYPVSMAALSRPKPEDARFAERFEVYVCSVELANAFGELTDAKVQRERFLKDVAQRRVIYGDDYPVDEDFLAAIAAGLKPCSGNALGMDRLVMLVTGAEHIDLVQAAPVAPDKKQGWTALHYLAAAEAEGVDVAEMVKAVLDAGANPHQPDAMGETAFNVAAPASPVAGRLMTLHWLQSGKGLNDRSGSHGSTLAQYIAKWLQDDELEAAFKTQGLKVDVPNASGWTPLHAAAAMGRVKAVEVLASLMSRVSTTESYTAIYNGNPVTYTAGLDAKAVAAARLAQDRGLSDGLRRDLQYCIDILGA